MSVTADHELEPLPLWQCGIALSSALAIFGAWAWLTHAGVFTSSVTAESAGYVLLAVLSVVLQVSSNFAAAAARRARSMELTQSFRWSVALMTAGAGYNAFSVHHAWEVTGLIGPGADAGFALLILVLSVVLAGFEPALYWIDEALKGEAANRRAADQDRRAANATASDKAAGEARVARLDDARGRRSQGARRAAAAMAGVLAIGTAGAALPAREAKAVERPLDRAPRPADAVSRAQAEERALAMLIEGAWSRRAIERKTGLHRDTIARLAATIARAETIAA